MADTKITALSALTAADPANDVLPIVDVNDPFMAASGTTKKISINNILGASGTATLASATITGDLTVATDRLKVNTGSTAVQIGSTTQTQFGTTSWPTDLISKANSRVLIGNLGTTLLWNESSPAIGNASTLYIGAKTGAGATTFGGGYISAGTENASDRSGFLAVSTFQSNGIDRERYRIDSTGVHTWQYVGGVAGTAMTLNATGLGVGVAPGSGKIAARAGTAATGNSLYADNIDGTYNPWIQIQHSSAGIKIFNSSSFGGSSNNLIFGNGTTSETMRIDSSGNVGISRASTGNKLEAPGVGIDGRTTVGGVSTVATTIYTIKQSATAAMCVVFGDDGSNGFCDIVLFLATVAPKVVSSQTLYGSPAARTYSASTTNLQLALASGSLSVRTAVLSTLNT